MDQSAFLVLLVAALLAQEPTPTKDGAKPSQDYLVPPVLYCHSVSGEKQQLADIKLDNPNSKQLSPDDQQKLQKLAEFMRQHNCGVRVEGYTDSMPKNRRTQDDLTRAKTVMDYLTNGLPEPQRVPADHVAADGKGVLDTPPGLTVDQKKVARIIL
jgi:outer membrane protein OmpA-like peptidoglycan-associated protein